MVIESRTSTIMIEGQKRAIGETYIEDEKGEIRSDVWGKFRVDVYGVEILSYLPARNLQILKTVCKDWLQLITSPYFVTLHHSRANRSYRVRVLVLFTSTIIEYTNYYHGTKKIPYPPKFSGGKTAILGCADGLMCLLDEKRAKGSAAFTLINPSTGKCSGVQHWPILPEFYMIFCSWFGKRVDGEYVLVMGTYSIGRRCEFGVYKFASSNLERIHSVPIEMQVPYSNPFVCDRGTLVHGAVHWAVSRCAARQTRYMILAYHVDENKYWEISPPTQCDDDFRLGVNNVDGCLLAIVKNNIQGVFQVWVMKECWTKYGNIEGFNYCTVLSPLGIFPNGDLILDGNEGRLIKYSFEDKKAEILLTSGCVRDGVMCADSLMSPSI